jgi:uncharacterized protein YjdB
MPLSLENSGAKLSRAGSGGKTDSGGNTTSLTVTMPTGVIPSDAADDRSIRLIARAWAARGHYPQRIIRSAYVVGTEARSRKSTIPSQAVQAMASAVPTNARGCAANDRNTAAPRASPR